MIKIEVDISAIRNEITQIHQELHSTYNMTDTQRRDAVNRLVEKIRHLKSLLDNNQVTTTLK